MSRQFKGVAGHSPQGSNGMIDQIKAAAERLKGVTHVTPVMTSRTLDQLADARVWLKCENFQRMGPFKFRGAYNAISKLTEGIGTCF